MFNRSITLQGTKNTRDLGGLITTTGHTTNLGVFIRSDSIANLTPEDFICLKRRDLKTIIDMRTKNEAYTIPSYIIADKTISYHWIPVELAARNKEYDSLSEVYINVLEDQSGTFREIFNCLSSAAGLCMFNCNGGKDRTGIISMLLLDIAGVELSCIIEDYMQTKTNMEPTFTKLRQRIKENKCDIPLNGLECLPEFVVDTLSHIKQVYSSTWSYLNSIGVKNSAIIELLGRFISN